RAEALVVEIDDRAKIRGGPVVEVGGTRGEATEDRPLELADVRELARDERAAGIRSLHGPAVRLVLQRVERQVQRAPRLIGEADVEWRHDRVVAGVRGVVAGGAGPLEGRRERRIEGTVEVQPRDAGDCYSYRIGGVLIACEREP